LRLRIKKMISSRIIMTVTPMTTPAMIFVRAALEPPLGNELVLGGRLVLGGKLVLGGELRSGS
jgi:hypothetical protein